MPLSNTAWSPSRVSVAATSDLIRFNPKPQTNPWLFLFGVPRNLSGKQRGQSKPHPFLNQFRMPRCSGRGRPHSALIGLASSLRIFSRRMSNFGLRRHATAFPPGDLPVHVIAHAAMVLPQFVLIRVHSWLFPSWLYPTQS